MRKYVVATAMLCAIILMRITFIVRKYKNVKKAKRADYAAHLVSL